MKLFLIVSLLFTSVIFAQLDTAGLGDNTWVDKSPTALAINGSNWAYENDFKSHPFYNIFILGPGHYIHPQDCYWYPFDPLTNKWTKIHSAYRPPRQCLSSFAINSQDTVIVQLGGGEMGHQLSQGGFAADYKSILSSAARGSRIWVYSFNRNEWYHMRGPVDLPGNAYTALGEYDPVHDIVVSSKGASTRIYNFHNNAAASTGTPANFEEYAYSEAMDTRRGVYYVINTNGLFRFSADNMAWAQVPGTTPPYAGSAGGGNGISLNTMAYDEQHDVLLYLTDVTLAGVPNVATWVFHCDTQIWEQMSPALAPQDMGRLAYNKALNVFMLLGGTAVGTISRGGGTQGIWFYRYKRGGSIFDTLAPAPVAKLTTAGGTARLSWTNVSQSGATGYNVYRGTATPYPKNYAKLNASPLTDTFYTDASATAGTAYAYRICAVKNGTEGCFSRILYTKPGRVLRSVASVEDAQHVALTWRSNTEPDIVGYNVYRASGAAIYTAPLAGNYTKVNSAVVTDTFFSDNVDLSDGVARGYVVTAVNGFGLEGGPSPECTTFPNPPDWVSTINQTYGGSLQTALRWQPPLRTRVTGVNLYLFQNTKINTALIPDSVSYWPVVSVGSITSSYEAMGGAYYARAVNVLGQEGFMSDEVSAVVTDWGYGMVPTSQRFNYSQYNNPPAAIERSLLETEDGSGLKLYPNPSNPAINIGYHLMAPAHIRITLLDLTGKKIQSMDRKQTAGNHVERLNFRGCGSGVYIVRLVDGNRILEAKAVFIK